MDERDWQLLTFSLQQRNCILLLGQELATTAGDASLTSLLADYLEAQLVEAALPPTPSPRSFPMIAERYADKFGSNALDWAVVGFYRSHQQDASEIHSALAALPFYFVLTSCHDELLENAMRLNKKVPRSTYYNYNGDKPADLPMGTVSMPLIYHLYGSPHEPKSLVLTEVDLLDFLVAVVSTTPPLPNSIRAELQGDKTFLFLGFGIKHWYLRILLHVLRFQSKTRSFALEAFSRVRSDMDQIILYYRSGYRIEVFEMPADGFVSELLGRYQAEAATTALRASAGASPSSAKLFICHADEDSVVAGDLRTVLAAAGFSPWLDKAELKSGDTWDLVIKETIESADYFIVLQSKALAAKKVAYVNKEITLALEHQKYVRQGIRFILPVQIDESELLPELSGLQTRPLRNREDMEALVNTIVHDQEQRLTQ